MLHVSVIDKNKLFKRVQYCEPRLRAVAFNFLPDDVATSWMALLMLAINKNTHSNGLLISKCPFVVSKSTKKPTKFS